MRAGILISVVLTAVVLLCWMLFAQRGDRPVETDTASSPVGEHDDHAPALHGLGTSLSGAPQSAKSDSTEVEPEAGTPEEFDTASPWIGARVRVNIQVEPGKYGGKVFAIPASEPLELEMEPYGIRRDWEGSPSLVLDLPMAGTWHVGFTCYGGFGGDVVENVRVEADALATVDLHLPSLGSIQLKLDGEAPKDVLKRIFVRARAIDDGSRQSLIDRVLLQPSVGHGRSFGVSSGISELPKAYRYQLYASINPARRRVKSPSGKSGRFKAMKREYWVSLSTNKARCGDTVQVILRRLGWVQLRCSRELPSQSSVIKRSPTIVVRLVRVDASEDAPDKKQPMVHAGHMGGARHTMNPSAPPGTWEIRPSEGYRVKGNARVTVVAGQTTNADVEFESIPGFRHEIATQAQEELVEIVPTEIQIRPHGAMGEDDECQYYAWGINREGETEQEDGDFQGRDTDARGQAAVTLISIQPTSLYVAQMPMRAYRNLAVNGSATIQAALEPAGYFMVFSEVPLPQGLGLLEISLHDDSIMPFAKYDEDDSCFVLRGVGSRVHVTPGSLIGPLPAGNYSFNVFLGGVKVATISATIVAGRIKPLAIAPPRR